MPSTLEPPWWTAPREGRRRQPLTRDQIVDAAVKILDTEGTAALRFRRLGEELGTGAASLYWHISGKDELAELVYDRIMGEIELPEPDGSRWQEQLKMMGRQAYATMLRHNDVVRWSIGRIPVGPNMLRLMEWSLELARQAGIPDRAAAYFGDIFGRFLDASALEVSDAGGPDPETVGDYFSALPADRFPNMARLAATMVEGDNDERFDFGLDLLISGLAATIKPKPREK